MQIRGRGGRRERGEGGEEARGAARGDPQRARRKPRAGRVGGPWRRDAEVHAGEVRETEGGRHAGKGRDTSCGNAATRIQARGREGPAARRAAATTGGKGREPRHPTGYDTDSARGPIRGPRKARGGPPCVIGPPLRGVPPRGERGGAPVRYRGPEAGGPRGRATQPDGAPGSGPRRTRGGRPRRGRRLSLGSEAPDRRERRAGKPRMRHEKAGQIQEGRPGEDDEGRKTQLEAERRQEAPPRPRGGRAHQDNRGREVGGRPLPESRPLAGVQAEGA